MHSFIYSLIHPLMFPTDLKPYSFWSVFVFLLFLDDLTSPVITTYSKSQKTGIARKLS
jgi:hypothetical protein